MASFTGKQKAFIYAYINTLNATEAARRAGYIGDDRTLAVTGHRALRNAKVKVEIERLFAENVMGPSEVLARIDDTARVNMAEFVKVSDQGEMTWDFKKARDLGKLHQIKKISYGKYGITLELYDRQRAEETLARHYGLLKDNLTVDVNLIVSTIETLEKAGYKASEVFEKMVQRIADEQKR